MKTINETLVALYYRPQYLRPDDNQADLVCICESERVAHSHIKYLMEEHPDYYRDGTRFYMNLVMYVRRAY